MRVGVRGRNLRGRKKCEGRKGGRRNSGIKEDELMTMCCCEAEEIAIPVIFAVEVGLKSSSEFPQACSRNLVGNDPRNLF